MRAWLIIIWAGPNFLSFHRKKYQRFLDKLQIKNTLGYLNLPIYVRPVNYLLYVISSVQFSIKLMVEKNALQ